ncbi:uncharacterized protein LOC131878436 [Tigriopus californicus]|uniref:uncharacterized protein LOC131878436 n=1 Tax=Tigriopus californicus TaxID=6832 RepID=UPI0027DA9B9D|nr:uncharacterized protein LOC131878436 [Tigriopus californicus]
MALLYAPGDFQAPYHNDLYHHQRPWKQPFESSPSFTPSFKEPFGAQTPAQNRQGLIQVIAPIGLLITLAVTILVGLYSNFVNEQNNNRFLEAEAQSNNAIPPVITTGLVMPTGPQLTRLDLQAVPLNELTILEGLEVTIEPVARQTSTTIMGETDAEGKYAAAVQVGVPITVTLSGQGLITIEKTIVPLAQNPPVIMLASKPLEEGEVVAMLTWTDAILDFDIAAITSECCLLNFAETSCLSPSLRQPRSSTIAAELTQDTILDIGVEILTFSGVTAADTLTIFANNNQEDPEIGSSGAIVTVLIGDKAVSTNIPTSDPNPVSLFWIAGEIQMMHFVPTVSESLKTIDFGTCQTIIDQNFGGI